MNWPIRRLGCASRQREGVLQLRAGQRLARSTNGLCTRFYSVSGQTELDSTNNPGPLKGVRVLDLSRVLAAPFCAQILADYGADVVKVEALGKGDDTRHWKVPGENERWDKNAGPMSNYFTAINRNKRSITLDLKHPKGKEVLRSLAKTADVLLENFKPGTMDRLGLGYDRLKEENPGLIYASVSGYGTSGPFANRGGYDQMIGAEAGLLHITGERNGRPVRPGLGLVDMSTGLYTHGAILAALYARAGNGGKGQRIDASLFETQISLLTNVALSWLNLGIEAERWGCGHPSIAPYDAFPTKDLYFACGATNDAQFVKLCNVLGQPDLAADARFTTNPKRVENRDILMPRLEDLFRTKTTAAWMDAFEGTGLPFAPINNMERTFVHPQVAAREMLTQISEEAFDAGTLHILGPAVKFSETRATIRRKPPRLGQHTDEVLAEAGWDVEAIAALHTEGVV